MYINIKRNLAILYLLGRVTKRQIEYDIVVQMSPKRKYTINLEVKSISKAEPKIVGPN